MDWIVIACVVVVFVVIFGGVYAGMVCCDYCGKPTWVRRHRCSNCL